MYRIHKLYELIQQDESFGTTHVTAAVLDKSNAISTLTTLLQTVRNDSETMDGFVALVSYPNKAHFLEAADETYHQIAFGQRVSINGVEYDNVMMLDDLPCLFVPQSRMKTATTVQDGAEDGGGIVAAPEAKDIHALIVHCETPLAVSKLDAIKQFGPEENQFFDGTSIQARYLYDLFVESKRLPTIGAVVAE